MIELTNVFKHFSQQHAFYGKSVKKQCVINNLNIRFEDKEVIGIVGKNGSGKSTLIKMLYGALNPDQGKILFDGCEDKYQEHLAKFSYFSNNDRSFFWRLSLRDNLNYFSCLNEGGKLANINEDLMRELEIYEVFDTPFYKLSSGQKKKSILFRGLLKKPSVLLFDEFTQSIDIFSKVKIENYIKELVNKESIKNTFWISHDLNEIKKLCNRVIVLQDGQVKKDVKSDIIGNLDTKDIEEILIK